MNVFYSLLKLKYNVPTTIFNDHKGAYCWHYGPIQTIYEDHALLSNMLFEVLKDSIRWSPRGRQHEVCWYTDEKSQCLYEFDLGRPHAPVVFPPFMLILRDHMMEVLNYPKDDPPNSCYVNLYKNGEACIGTHTDNEPIFNGNSQPINIISFSVGQKRRFEIREFKFWKDAALVGAVEVDSLSYMTMQGNFQQNYKHSIPKQPGIVEPRINLTWRWVVNKKAGNPGNTGSVRNYNRGNIKGDKVDNKAVYKGGSRGNFLHKGYNQGGNFNKGYNQGGNSQYQIYNQTWWGGMQY